MFILHPNPFVLKFKIHFSCLLLFLCIFQMTLGGVNGMTGLRVQQHVQVSILCRFDRGLAYVQPLKWVKEVVKVCK